MEQVRLDWSRLRYIDVMLLGRWSEMDEQARTQAVLAICDNLIGGGLALLPFAVADSVLVMFGREAPAALARLAARHKPQPIPIANLATYTAQPRSEAHCHN